MDQKQLDTIISQITEQIISRLNEKESNLKALKKAQLYILTDKNETKINQEIKTSDVSFLRDQYDLKIINFTSENYQATFPKNLNEEDKVLLTSFPFYDVAKAALGIVDDTVTFWISKTFFLGRKVLLLKDGKRPISNKNKKYSELFLSYMKTLNEFGLQEIYWKDLNRNLQYEIKTTVLTLADIEKLPSNKTVSLNSATILTELAREKIAEKNLKIIYK
ncbi:MAG: hypothetical protein ABF804_10985 [Liquorilactobacillus ghanensis]|uniref:hypothetical protein n=1 Tax=Liquorilactobacillus ghanensis TaxID=399370 RepID=UPI0039EB0B84